MPGSEITWSAATDQADWIGPWLAPFAGGTAASTVPGGFAAYVRLLHPMHPRSELRAATVRWAQVAAWSGLTLTRQAQFLDITVPEHPPSEPAPWDGEYPTDGSLPDPDATVLTELLAAHTPTPGRCWFCVWEGYGWLRPTPDGNPGARVQLPFRNYLLHAGAVRDALALVDTEQQTPNLWWPQDRSWCVASEIDDCYTYVAGSAALIDEVLADPRLEAQPVRLDDSTWSPLPAWIIDAVRPGATELLEHGTATVTTGWGTVHATLQRPRTGQGGWLETRTRHGTSGSIVRRVTEDELHQQALDSLGGAVVSSVHEVTRRQAYHP